MVCEEYIHECQACGLIYIQSIPYPPWIVSICYILLCLQSNYNANMQFSCQACRNQANLQADAFYIPMSITQLM